MTKLSDVTLTPEKTLPPAFVKFCKSVTAKRARIVINHILKHGIITNEDLSDIYGYAHPPRALQDVKENGIPLLRHSVVSEKNGRQIGAYTFGNFDNVKGGRLGGRRAFPKSFKGKLIGIYGQCDAFTGELLDERYLQIDHRIPYAIAGDGFDLLPQNYMLLDASSQRKKSWSCEHCENYLALSDPETCRTCFWASPENYEHIAMKPSRRVEIVWSGQEVADFERMKLTAQRKGIEVSDLIKDYLRK